MEYIWVEGTPLSSPQDNPACERGPHLFFVEVRSSDQMVVHPVSFQHCCEDHGGAVCNGWVALDVPGLIRKGKWRKTV